MHVGSLIKRLRDYPFIVSTYCTLLWRVNAYKSGTMSKICICIQLCSFIIFPDNGAWRQLGALMSALVYGQLNSGSLQHSNDPGIYLFM